MLRELEESEKVFCRKQVKRIREEITHLEYLLEYNELMINKGLWQNYLEKKEEFKGIRQQIHMDMKMCWEKLGVLQGQMDKGVEVKEKETIVGMG